mgnify:CR=1 FL=1
MKTDQQLTQDIHDELQWEPAIQAGLIEVQASGGVVTLRGEVPSGAECWSAERAARRVAGVRRLVLLLVVRAPSAGPRLDADIAHAARTALAWLVDPPVSTVQVAVLRGCVTLTGQVAWPWQKPSILGTLRLLPGVLGLTDGMLVQPGPPQAAPQPPDGRPIEAAIRRRITSGPLQVQVRGSGVTLSGAIRTQTERALAHHAAWGTPGVRAVHDRLQLVG